MQLINYNQIEAFLKHLYADERARIEFLSHFMIASALITFVSFNLLGMRASYGRYSPDSALFKVFLEILL